jgi:NitT/TauT family transport system substrate-binding protein
MCRPKRLMGVLIFGLAVAGACAPAGAPTPSSAASAAPAPSSAGAAASGAAGQTTAAPPTAASPGGAAPAASEGNRQKITVAYSTPSGSHLPIYLAAEQGLFPKHGLEAELVYMASGTSTMQSLVAGDVQFAQTSGTEVATAYLGGAPVRMLIGWVSTVPSLFMVAPTITTPEQLRGQPVGVTRFGSQSHSGARLALKYWGMNPDDVSYLQLGGVPEILGGMQTGAVIGGVYTPPTNVQARRLGFRALGDLSQMGIAYQGTGLLATEPYVETNPDVTRRVVRALLEGIKLYLTDDAASRAALGKYTKLEDAELLDESIAYYRMLLQRVPYPSLEGLQVTLDDLADMEPRARDLQPRQLVDTRALEQLEREGFLQQLWGE